MIAAAGTGQSWLDQRREQVLPAGLFLGVAGAQGVVAEQQRDELQTRLGGHVDLVDLSRAYIDPLTSTGTGFLINVARPAAPACAYWLCAWVPPGPSSST
ncbi:hypothetical protein ABZ345_07825 [Lentzea sp. NPDC005914]|uniref:hypothetical protein n=1 Tax=Lentzea sp. NPDC005914 TaxID=3154572 RepID=UPI0033D0802E